jgi:opacity protein-like surface antigen
MIRKVVAAALLVAGFSMPADAGPYGCWGGASIGRGIETTRVGSTVTVAASGAMAGIEAGCDYDVSSIVTIGVMARYDWLDVSSSLGGLNMDSDGMWTVALRAGVKINPDLLAYAMAGYSGTDITLPGIDFSPEGITYGAGLEADVAKLNLTLYVEWSRTELQDHTSSILGRIEPSHDTIRAGVRYKFDLNGTLK